MNLNTEVKKFLKTLLEDKHNLPDVKIETFGYEQGGVHIWYSIPNLNESTFRQELILNNELTIYIHLKNKLT